MAFKVLVDDNFHYMDAEERYELGDFDSLDAAVEAARKIVDDQLASAYRSGMSAAELFENYKSFGEDPFIVGGERGKVHFSA